MESLFNDMNFGGIRFVEPGEAAAWKLNLEDCVIVDFGAKYTRIAVVAGGLMQKLGYR